jgi:hypothetical protein
MRKRKRHKTPDEIKAELAFLAREKRMANITPWTAVGIMFGYVLLQSEGFKAKRIFKIIQDIDRYNDGWHSGTVNVEELSQRLMDKAEWSIEYEDYTEADIMHRKGSYEYFLDEKQISAMNMINQISTRYLIFGYVALMDEYGYGKERLTRVQKCMNDLLLQYQENRTNIEIWKKELLENAGIAFEMPRDENTSTIGSTITGVY